MDIILSNKVGEVIEVDGVCYQFVEFTHDLPTGSIFDETFENCSECEYGSGSEESGSENQVVFGKIVSPAGGTFDPSFVSESRLWMEATPPINGGVPLEGNSFSVAIAPGTYEPYLITDFPELVTVLVVDNDEMEEVYGAVFPNLRNLTAAGGYKLNTVTMPPSLRVLSVAQGNLTSLDLTAVTALQTVSAYDMPSLTSIDVSGLVNLGFLSVGWGSGGGTSISSLDISTNPNLWGLRAESCANLTAIDVTNNPKLTSLDLFLTPITTLDLSNNPVLQHLDVQGCSLSALDISNNPLIDDLDASYNSLSQSAVDNIFINLDNGGLSNGIADLGGTGNAAPSAASSTARFNLSTKGWSINHN
jgi:hypothetical protein